MIQLLQDMVYCGLFISIASVLIYYILYYVVGLSCSWVDLNMNTWSRLQSTHFLSSFQGILGKILSIYLVNINVKLCIYSTTFTFFTCLILLIVVHVVCCNFKQLFFIWRDAVLCLWMLLIRYIHCYMSRCIFNSHNSGAVVPWQCQPVRLCDLGTQKLVGLCRRDRRPLSWLLPTVVRVNSFFKLVMVILRDNNALFWCLLFLVKSIY